MEIQYPNLTSGFTAANVPTTDKQYAPIFRTTGTSTSHLSLNLGIRWDHEVVPSFLDFVTPANVLDAINKPYPGSTLSVADTWRKGRTGYDIFDYVSNGHTVRRRTISRRGSDFLRSLRRQPSRDLRRLRPRIQPQPVPQRWRWKRPRSRLNGNPPGLFPVAADPGPVRAPGGCFTPADINPDKHCYAWDPAYLTPEGLAAFQAGGSSNEVDLLNNHLKTPHSDQFSLGMRNKLGDWNTQATLSFIESFDAHRRPFGQSLCGRLLL